MNNKNEAIDYYKSNYEKIKNRLPFDLSLRDEAVESLLSNGFPTLKDEEWRYTNVAPVLKERFEVPELTADIENSHIEEKFLTGFDFDKLVFIDGQFSPELSDDLTLPEGAVIGSLKNLYEAEKEKIDKFAISSGKFKTGFDALNRAFAEDGFYAYIPKGTIVERPLQVLFYSTSVNKLNSPRNIVIAEESSSLKLIFNYCGSSGIKYFTNTVNEYFIDENAQVDIYKFQDENREAFHIDRTDIVQKNSSVFSHYSFSFGADLARSDINARLDGENVTCNLFGLYLGSEKRHVDHHTFVDHAKPNSVSNELYKGILDDESNGVFSGKILVRQVAQKTNAYQSNKNVLLTKTASVDTKPQLEIYADDVKCSHGATVGSLNDEAYFYIRSRGVPADIAKSMLIRAFASDVLEKVKIEGLRETLNHLIFEHLHRIEI